MFRVLLQALLLLLPGPLEAEVCSQGPVAGKVTNVAAGDELELNGFFLIRLQGLAAPTWDDPGAAQAAASMRKLVLGRMVTCELNGGQTRNRCTAVCALDGIDIADVLVRMGHARDCPYFSGGRYQAAELQAAAQGAKIGEMYALPAHCR
jgi:endonuclease YncB( thermonuclease family)